MPRHQLLTEGNAFKTLIGFSLPFLLSNILQALYGACDLFMVCLLYTSKEFRGVCGVYHCYSGSWEMAKILLNLGYYLSFNGVITFKNARRSLEVIQKMPLDRLMLETDAPYLSPVPYRGKRNDSTRLPLVAETIAALLGQSAEEIGAITMANGRRFFNIP